MKVSLTAPAMAGTPIGPSEAISYKKENYKLNEKIYESKVVRIDN